MRAIYQKTAFHQSRIFHNYFLKTTGNLKSKVLSFSFENNYYVLLINIESINKNNYNVLIEKSKLIILVADNYSFGKPIYHHNLNNNPDSFEYEVVKYVDVCLPSDNFFLLRHYLDVEKGNLKVILKSKNSKFN